LLSTVIPVRGAVGPVHHRRLAPGQTPDGRGERHDRQAGVAAPARRVARPADSLQQLADLARRQELDYEIYGADVYAQI